jgi:hypothetical protein
MGISFKWLFRGQPITWHIGIDESPQMTSFQESLQVGQGNSFSQCTHDKEQPALLCFYLDIYELIHWYDIH